MPPAVTPVPPARMKGMAQQIVVKKAAELSVKAPAGEFVAVLDQSGSTRDPKQSKSQDHNNGWLSLTPGVAEGGVLKATGKYYLPAATTNAPTTLRFTVRKQSKTGILVYSDKSLKVVPTDTDRWVDFEIELPLKDPAVPSDTNYILMLSAAPLAGPLYLDNVEVKDAAGKAFWAYPSFE